jgi:hypothetical protein
MVRLPLTAMAVLALTSLVHGQSPDSQEISSQHREEWLRSLDHAPIQILEHFRRSASGEMEDFGWSLSPAESLSDAPDKQKARN